VILLFNLTSKLNKLNLDATELLDMLGQFTQKKRQGVLEHSLPHLNHTATTGMVSSIQPLNGSSVKHQALLSGIDSLFVTAGGATEPSAWFLEQTEIWDEYSKSYEYGEEYICIDIGGQWFQLYPYGSNPYKYQLRNAEIGFIKLWSPHKWSSGIQSKQLIHLQLCSKYIHSHSITQLNELVKSICSHFVVDTSALQILISRIDLHTDITNGSQMLSHEEIENTITRCRTKSAYYNDKEVPFEDIEVEQLKSLLNDHQDYNKVVGKLITPDMVSRLVRLIEEQTTNGAKNIISKNEIETAYFGKLGSNIWGKVYNKTKEVQFKNDTDTPLLWSQQGWNGTDTIVRVEFSLKRKFLKELDNGDYVSLEEFINSIDKVWNYLTSCWLRFVEQKNINNSTWSKVSPFWIVVQNSFKSVSNTIIRKKNYQGKINQLWKQGIGCLKQMVSLGMKTNEDTSFFLSTSQAVESVLNLSYNSGEYFKRRQILGIA